MRLAWGLARGGWASWDLRLESLKSVKSFAKRFIREVGELDVLINNAGKPPPAFALIRQLAASSDRCVACQADRGQVHQLLVAISQ